MNSILRITDPIPSDDSIDKYEDIAYEPVAGTNLNSSGQDIRLTIETQDIFTHPSESYLIIEGRLLKADNNAYAAADLITLTNNGIMHLFKRIRYDLSGQEIENIMNVGQATTMLGLLKYPDDFSKSTGLNQLWYKDTSVRENITRVLRNNRGTKVKLIFKCEMERPSTLGETVIKPANFSSEIHINLDGTDEVDIYITMVERILENMAVFQSLGSGWRLYNIIKLELHTVSYTPLRGETWIALPKELANKNAIINMKNTDNKCFLWCVLRALNPYEKNPQRIDKKLKEKENTLNMDGIEYPVSLKDIDKFEKQNPTISITVFSYNEKNKVFPLRVSKYAYTREVNILLMLIEKDGVKHYTWVKNISRLLSSQVSNHKEKHHFCLRCLDPFWSHKSLEKHLEYCRNHEAVKIEMPEKGKNDILKFKNYCNSEKVPFIIYADTESLIKSIQTCEADPEKSYTKKYQKHEPISFSYYIK